MNTPTTMKQLPLILLCICQIAFGQYDRTISEVLVGDWEGAFIKNNSYQKIDIQFSERGGEIFGLQIMDEWHPTFGEFEVPIEIDSIGKIKFSTGYGKAALVLDKNNLELIGQLEDFNPSMYVHLKKVAPRPNSNYTIEEVSMISGTSQIAGHLHIPKQSEHKTAVIIVGGRGCYADQTKYNLYAKFLRKYGVSVLAYQKRGTGKSTGDCSKATITDLSNDLIAAKAYLESHPNNYKNIGVLGISAGGWTMTKAEEKTDFDFMVSIVGPATSVRDQQFQSMQYGAKFYNLEAAALNNLKEYTELMFSAKADDQAFATMNDLLSFSEDQNWKQLLDETDIPTSASEIDDLWVRRHNYDPKSTLLTYKNPFLAIYGDRDWIVPHKENIALLEAYFKDKKQLLKTVIAFNAEHGMEMEAKPIDLGNNKSYWHFYRISPEVRIEIINFLRRNNFVE